MQHPTVSTLGLAHFPSNIVQDVDEEIITKNVLAGFAAVEGASLSTKLAGLCLFLQPALPLKCTYVTWQCLGSQCFQNLTRSMEDCVLFSPLKNAKKNRSLELT